ncbi:hypothetical protein EG68_06842 [Paragonimus skrjabini miyazakii]|uniref:Uncharacterized protein n=1 Tax=Paragonimus skrjabini miyazakii TaxID=59628 RepID=A0A8S9YWS0_9TREM|nr:hypothetical protein EG68_06842 [Paragonimus skrjabini miyazakii]
MPRLRSQSVNFQLSLRSSGKDLLLSSKVSDVKGADIQVPKQTRMGSIDVGTKLKRGEVKSKKVSTRPGRKLQVPAESNPQFMSVTSTIKTVQKLDQSVKPVKNLRKPSVDRNRTKKEKKPVDPYAFDQLFDSDDEKENIDPQERVHRRGKKVCEPPGIRSPKLNVKVSQPPSCASSFPLCGRSSLVERKRITVLERLQSVSATIRLPLPTPLTATPLVAHAPMASTPAVLPPAGSVTRSDKIASLSPLVILSPVVQHHNPFPSNLPSSPDIEPDDEKEIELTHHSANVSLEPFVDDEPEKRIDTPSHESSKGHSAPGRSSSGSRKSRKLSESDREDAYNSWLDEFNEQLKQFESHNLTMEN